MAGQANAVRSFWAGNRERLIDAGAAFSLANLCFVNVWAQLFDPASINFFQKSPPPQYYIEITIANILLLGVMIFTAIALARALTGVPRTLAEFAYLGILLVPLNIARTRFLFLGFGLHSWRTLAVIVAAIPAGWALVRYRKTVIRLTRHGLLILLPFLPLAYVESMMQRASMMGADKLARTAAYPRLHPGINKPIRVVWVIFDELDACMAFARRSPDVQLPELDRLQSQSTYATKAASPASNTIESLPSLFTGKIVEKSRIDNLDDLKLLYRGASNYHLFSKETTAFSRAHALGLNTGIAGWYLPYCRLFPFTSCYWEPITSVFLRGDYAQYLSFLQSMWFQLSQQLAEVPGVYAVHASVGREAWTRLPKARRVSREHSILEYRHIHDEAMGELGDRGLDIVFLHWPTPHPLYFYDRNTADFTTRDGPNYFDALTLVDRTVGDIRRTLEQAGDWDNTALLVSADHPLRSYFLRPAGYWTQEEERSMGNRTCSYVPFLLKMPGQHSGIAYDRPMNTVLSGDLLLDILTGTVPSEQGVVQWLDAHSNPPAHPAETR
jgi:hypothetical protein